MATKAKRKVETREAAMKVITDNMKDRKKRMADLEASKRADADQLEANMRNLLEKEQTREREIADRGRRI